MTLARRIVSRYLEAAENVRVRHLATGEVMEITRGELRASPDAYETLHAHFVPPTDAEVAKAREDASQTSWVLPDLDAEREEFQRSADTLGVPIEEILSALPSARPMPLSNIMWQRMRNTDSWDVDTVEKAIEYARMYDKDVRDILLGLGGDMQCPIVLVLPGNVPMLVGGNTRLMTFHAIGVRPVVLAVDVRHLPAEVTSRAQAGSG